MGAGGIVEMAENTEWSKDVISGAMQDLAIHVRVSAFIMGRP